jgi:hypothetical protein
MLKCPKSFHNLILQSKQKMIETINKILNKLFPFKEYHNKQSYFMSDTWLQKNMQEPYLKDWIWSKR